MAVDVREGWNACNSRVHKDVLCVFTDGVYEGAHCGCWLENEVCCWCGEWCGEQRKEE